VSRRRLLAFGGSNSDPGSPERHGFDDLWALSLSGAPTWTLLGTSGLRPSPRDGHTMIYDPVRDRLVLFGGRDTAANVSLDDLWVLDLGTLPLGWSQWSTPGPRPSARCWASAVYDSLDDRLVLFGGATVITDNAVLPAQPLGDVWALPLDQPPVKARSSNERGSPDARSGAPPGWIQLSPAGAAPSARAGAQAIYDTARRRMVVHGGLGSAVLGDVWALSLDASPTWAELSPTGMPPPPRGAGAAIHDPVNGRMLIYGGIGGVTPGVTLGDLWALTLGSLAWNELAPAGGPPPPRQFPSAVYDLAGRRMIVFGGSRFVSANEDIEVTDPVWSLNLDASPRWTPVGGDLPPRRTHSAGIYDPLRNRIVLYGGFQAGGASPGTFYSDTWELALGISPRWTLLTPAGGSPGPRSGHSAIYDPVRDRVLVFGGNRAATRYSDVWELTLGPTPRWTQLATSGGPPPERTMHAAIYDSRLDRMVVYGGNGGLEILWDIWTLDLATNSWSELVPGTLFGRVSPAAVYDVLHDRMVVMGGAPPGDFVRAFPFSGTPDWIVLNPSGSAPVYRTEAAAVYDTVAHLALMFGGSAGPLAMNDTWVLHLGGAPAWLQLDTGFLLPPASLSPMAVYDQSGSRLYVYVGESPMSDMWRLDFDRVTPVLVAVVEARAEPGRVELDWALAEPMSGISIQRCDGTSAWRAIAERDADSGGRVHFIDRDVLPGHRYGYRLGFTENGREVLAGEAWVEVPPALAFALQGARPNPSSGPPTVSFTLPAGRAAILEVLDTAGRRLFSREVGALGAGQHEVKVAPDHPLAPGVYWLRLTQDGRGLTAKVAVVR
jgi:hypothetical protein